jgi:3-hydroxy-D-aspartate aldolase
MKLRPEAVMGRSVQSIDTPALVIDLDAMERNLQRMQHFAAQHKVRLRPHAKMHKSVELALLQMHAGAVGVCVQKSSEAAALVAGGVRNVYVSNQVIALHKCELLAQLNKNLAAKNGQISIAVDTLLGVQRIAQAMASHGGGSCMDVYVEIDVGQARCGVLPGDAAVPLVRPLRSTVACVLQGCRPITVGRSTCAVQRSGRVLLQMWWQMCSARKRRCRRPAMPYRW